MPFFRIEPECHLLLSGNIVIAHKNMYNIMVKCSLNNYKFYQIFLIIFWNMFDYNGLAVKTVSKGDPGNVPGPVT